MYASHLSDTETKLMTRTQRAVLHAQQRRLAGRTEPEGAA